MWRYLIFGAAWFFVLFFAVNAKRAVYYLGVFFIMIAACAVAAGTSTDPFVWLFYAGASFLAFFSFYKFKRWNASRALFLDSELAVLMKDSTLEKPALELKEHENKLLEDKLDGIVHLYDKTKEMSQSLDAFEAFLIFGEVLYGHFFCGAAKLALWDIEENDLRDFKEVFALNRSDFKGIFDKAVFINDPKKRKEELFPYEKMILDRVREKGKALTDADDACALPDKMFSFSAFPVFVDQKVFAVLFLTEINDNDPKVLWILIGRFLSEIQRIGLYKHVETLALTDGLTGVAVRRHLLERFEREVERSKRFGFKLSFLMIDIDHFKNFNDHYGHLVGDAVLKQVAETIKLNIRELDLLGRCGGEEFGVLLIETDSATAFFIAQRIRQAVDERIFKAYGENLKVTISIGCSAYSPDFNNVSLIADSADSALYQAKRQGRNRVCSAELLDRGDNGDK